uniref:Uncharacterized protein n=1 Tax=Anopheles atroparvus TaxID=41427 RepID=A0AAG5D2G7_ANOAO
MLIAGGIDNRRRLRSRCYIRRESELACTIDLDEWQITLKREMTRNHQFHAIVHRAAIQIHTIFFVFDVIVSNNRKLLNSDVWRTITKSKRPSPRWQ